MSYTYLGRKEPGEEWTGSTTKVFYSIFQNTFGRQNHALGLSAGTVITKESKNPNNRVLLRALFFVCIVSFVVRNLCLGTYTEGTEPFHVSSSSATSEVSVRWLL